MSEQQLSHEHRTSYPLWVEGIEEIRPRSTQRSEFTPAEMAVVVSGYIDYLESTKTRDLAILPVVTARNSDAQQLLAEYDPAEDGRLYDYLSDVGAARARSNDGGDKHALNILMFLENAAEAFAGAKKGKERLAAIALYNNSVLTTIQQMEKPVDTAPMYEGHPIDTPQENSTQERGPIPSGTDAPDVAHARDAVNAAYASGTPEATQPAAERDTSDQQVLERVFGAAKGHTAVHTDLPPSEGRTFVINGEAVQDYHRTGFATLGDNPNGLNLHFETPIRDMRGATLSRHKRTDAGVESITFGNAFDETIVQVPHRERGMFGHRKITTRRQIVERPRKIKNPLTGTMEKARYVRYEFTGQSTEQSRQKESFAYHTVSRRPGNMLAVTVELPESIANELQRRIIARPQLAREFSKQFTASDRTGLTEADWNGSSSTAKCFRVGPPYELVDPAWGISMIDADANTIKKLSF